jgi:hypothetical protein
MHCQQRLFKISKASLTEHHEPPAMQDATAYMQQQQLANAGAVEKQRHVQRVQQ